MENKDPVVESKDPFDKIFKSVSETLNEVALYQVKQIEWIVSKISQIIIPIAFLFSGSFLIRKISPTTADSISESIGHSLSFIKSNAVEVTTATVLLFSLAGTAAVLFASQLQLKKRQRDAMAKALAARQKLAREEARWREAARGGAAPSASTATPRARATRAASLHAEAHLEEARIEEARIVRGRISNTRYTPEIQFVVPPNFKREQTPTSYIDIYNQFKRRMATEEERLKSNSGLNLFWGILFAVFAVVFLLVTIFYKPSSQISSTQDFIAAYGPRATLAIILELISFFFLRLYSATEQEIKHHKNEVTNMESKFAAALLAMDNPTLTTKSQVIKGFMSSERNFLLKKNEKTVASEMYTEYNDFKDTLSLLLRAAKPRNKKKVS